MELSKDELLRSYWIMKAIREFEERVHVEFATGEIPGFVHLYAGEEAIASGVCIHLRPEDKIASTHRGHGHCIAKGCDIEGMMAEIYGRKSGLCGGKGGSMHIADLEKGMMGANGIVGGGPPLVCGAGLAAKQLKNGGVAVAFVGDGGSNQGTTVEEVAREAVRRAREGGGPTLIECKVNRYYGHFEGDAQTYRGPNEVEKIRESRDCIDNFVKRVTAAGIIESAELEKIEREVMALIDRAVEKAKVASKPDAADLLTDVYVSY
jgi:TPP-dependent pyruvate/acetoin dehydrogenase alpha subunit